MKISLEWLSEFIEWKETDPQIIADRLTLSTAEVEEVEVQGALLERCCVGMVISVSKHPSADRLSIVDVKTDQGTKHVVCGGTNLREGMLVAFAHVGARVRWHGEEMMTLEPVKIRGIASDGMICAAEELGLETVYTPEKEDGERPIMDLERLLATGYPLSPSGSGEAGTLQAGQSLKDALNLNDAVLHINNTAITTRPDLFSHYGFARECVALGLGKWKKKPTYKLPKTTAKKTKGITLKIDCKELIPRYMSCVLECTSVGETPSWMKRRLEAVGIRSINLPVDITNYVTQEMGVPLHSFDISDIRGTVHMRLTQKGESIFTLDNEKRTLPEGVLVMSDDEGIFDLLGIMGGLRSSTKQSTRAMYMHALSIDPPTIRRAILGTGHRTDASTIYEKGVPPITTEHGFARAVELFLELVPGARIASAVEDKGDNGKPKTFTFSAHDIRAALGTDIPEKEISTTLTNLDFAVKKGTAKGTLSVTAPLHRLRDITGIHDVVEEVGRIHGFDSIAPVMPMAPLQLPDRDRRVHRMRDALKHAGFRETVPLSFVSPALLERCGLKPDEAIAIANPLGEETSLLQTHTLPQLLHQATHQITQTENDVLTFQWGRVFPKDKREHTQLTALIVAKNETRLLDDPFLRVKQAVIDAAADAGYALTVSIPTSIPPYAHPGRTARLLFKDTEIGTVYEIHPLVRKAFDLPHRAAAATIELGALLHYPATIPVYKPLSQFPAISYDVTVTREPTDELGPLLKKLRGSTELLEQVSVIDIYDGKPLAEGTYNLTLRFVYRSPHKTLTEDEVKREHAKVLQLMK